VDVSVPLSRITSFGPARLSFFVRRGVLFASDGEFELDGVPLAFKV
jgi:hypothetical protein